MPNNHESQGKATKPHKQTYIPFKSPAHPPTNDDEATKQGTRESNQKQNPPEQSRLLFRLSILFNALLFFATCTYTFFSYNQWRVMEKQTLAAFQQVSTAKGSIRIANDALKDTRESSKEQSDRAERMAKANEIIAQASKQSVETAKGIAKKSLNATIDNFHLEQRAWVGVINVSEGQHTEGGKKVYIKEGGKLTGNLVLNNSGKTPAQNVKSIVGVSCLESSAEFRPIYKKDATKNGPTITTIQPGATQAAPFPPFPIDKIASKADIENIVSGNYIIYVFGKISYQDIFRNQHTTTYCMFLDRDLTTLHDCNINNEAD